MFFRKLQPVNSNLLFGWLLSYVSILLIPVFISGIVSILSMRVMMNETDRANEAMLKRVQNNMDEIIHSYKEVAYQVCLDTNLKSLMNVNSEFQESNQFTIYTFMKQLALVITTNSYLEDLFIYHKASGSVLSKGSVMDTEYFYNLYFQDNWPNHEEMLSLLDEKHMMDYRKLEKRMANGENLSVVALFQSLPLILSREPSGTLIGAIPESKFQEIINDLKWIYQYEFLIVGGNGQVLMSNGPQKMPADFMQMSGVDATGKGKYTYQGKEYVVTSMISEEIDWKYVLVVPSEIFWEKTVYIRRMTLYSVLLCVLAGGVVAYFFTMKNYDPINKIVQSLIQKKTVKVGKNKYSFLHNIVNNNIQEMKGAYKKLEIQNEALKSNFLENLLKGRYSDEASFEEITSKLGLDIGGSPCAVLLFLIEDISGFKNESAGEPDDASFRLAVFSLSNVLNELVEEKNKGYIIEMDGMLACVVNFKNRDMEENKRALDDIIKRCQMCVQEQMHVYFTVSCSNVHDDLSGITEAYHEALDAMEYKRLIGSTGIIKYEHMENFKYSYHYPIETEQKLTNYIKTGELEKSKALLEEIFQVNLYNASFSGEMAKCLVFDITSTIVKAMYEISDTAFLESVQPIKRVLNCRTIMEMKMQIIHVVELACKYVSENDKNDRQLSKAVMEYIQENYYDANLSVSAISEKFNLTRPYLSMLFKSQAGHTLLECINKVRLKHAKQLLKEGKLSIADIACKTGYSNSSVFIRTFKKYEGITPGEYKAM